MRDRKEIEKELSPIYYQDNNSYDSYIEPLDDYLKRIIEIQTEILLDIRDKMK